MTSQSLKIAERDLRSTYPVNDPAPGSSSSRETRSFAELQAACLHSLKQCQGFEMVDEVLVQPRASCHGAANWTLAAVRPRVDNNALRGARSVIDRLQKTYSLDAAEAEAAALAARRRR